MARLRRRKNPVRSIGALLINPRGGRLKRRNPAQKQGVGGYTRVRPWTTYPAKKRKAALRFARSTPSRATIVKMKANPRKRHSKRRHSMKRNGLFMARRNPVRRSARGLRRRSRARRNPLFIQRSNPLFIQRTNGRKRKHSKRRARHGFRRNPANMLSKIPIVGGLLASASSFLLPAGFGAVAVEPILALTQFAAPYLPLWMPFSATIVVGGVVLGAVVKRYGPFAAATNDKLAVAVASAAGGIAYYEWRNGGDGPVGPKAGLMIASGMGSPIAGAIMGNAQIGALTQQAGFGNPMLGDYGPMAVSPLNAAQPSFVSVRY